MLPLLRSMSRRPSALSTASGRLQAVQRAMSSAPPLAKQHEKPPPPSKDGVSPRNFDTIGELPVLFDSQQTLRTYVLNRPKALNALNEEMIDLLAPKLEAWDNSKPCQIIVGTGKGRAFCAGGDVRAVTRDARNPETREKAALYFKKEFELDYRLATLRKPYVAILDGITMGGGLGLSMHAPFRVATENAQVAMPETKIGYAPDVGATFFLPRLDGKLGTYFALTGNTIKGRAVYELGFATHFVPSERIPKLIDRLAVLMPQDLAGVNAAIDEFAGEEYTTFETDLVGDKRAALDEAFGKDTVEEIIAALQEIKERGGEIGEWATQVLGELSLRSPTALKVALQAQHLGRGLTLREALQVELRFATAFCNGATPDFLTGVKAVLEDKIKGRPEWQPATLEEVSRDDIYRNFFSNESPFTTTMPQMDLFELAQPHNPMRWALPTEVEIGKFVKGEHKDSGSMAVTVKDVVDWFTTVHTNQKAGVALKIKEVLARRASTRKDGYLQWVH